MRLDWEKWEKDTLAPYASKSGESKGRVRAEQECAVRTAFQRDRDRIIHCKSFRRLKDKTQVFVAPESAHFRTRLAHTLDVAQIARTIARACWLNEDLTEAIALGHDLGHTPFGHAGERSLQAFYPEFTHNAQSLRVVDYLENDGEGLNLSFEVRDGILHHTGESKPATLEGIIVRYADRIAYINHDIDDAVRAKLLGVDDLPKQAVTLLGSRHSQRINSLVTDIIENSAGKAEIIMSEKVSKAMDELREYLFSVVYRREQAVRDELRAQKIIADLYYYYQNHFDKLPEYLAETLEETAVCDYIAGMTDSFAISEHHRLFGNKGR